MEEELRLDNQTLLDGVDELLSKDYHTLRDMGRSKNIGWLHVYLDESELDSSFVGLVVPFSDKIVFRPSGLRGRRPLGPVELSYADPNVFDVLLDLLAGKTDARV